MNESTSELTTKVPNKMNWSHLSLTCVVHFIFITLASLSTASILLILKHIIENYSAQLEAIAILTNIDTNTIPDLVTSQFLHTMGYLVGLCAWMVFIIAAFAIIGLAPRKPRKPKSAGLTSNQTPPISDQHTA